MRGAEIGTAVESARRDDLVQLGVWMFLGTVLMLFAAFTSAYIVRHGASDWTPIELPGLLWANTAVLIAASLALEGGRMAWSRGKGASGRRGVSAAIGLGALFLVGQLAVWRELFATHNRETVRFTLQTVPTTHLLLTSKESGERMLSLLPPGEWTVAFQAEEVMVLERIQN